MTHYIFVLAPLFFFFLYSIFCTIIHLGLSKSMEVYLYGPHKVWKNLITLPGQDISDTQDTVEAKQGEQFIGDDSMVLQTSYSSVKYK